MKSDLKEKIIVTVAAVSALLCAFFSYVCIDISAFDSAVRSVNEKSVKQENNAYIYSTTVQEFMRRYELLDKDSQISTLILKKKFNSFQLLEKASYIHNICSENENSKAEPDIQQAVKIFVTVIYIAFPGTWMMLVVAVLMVWVGKKRRKYLFSAVCSSVSVIFMLLIFLIPGLEKKIFARHLLDTEGVNGSLQVVAAETGVFGRSLLFHMTEAGYWAGIVFMATTAVVAIILYILRYRADNKVMFTPGRHLDRRGLMVGVSGAYAGIPVSLDTPIIIGRDSTCSHLIIEKAGISRTHCKVEYNAASQMYVITDYSSNGTYAGSGIRLEKGVATELDPGTIIRLGREIDAFELM